MEASAPGDRVTPHSLEAERALLGAVIINPAVWPRVVELVHEDAYFRHAHRLIHEAIAGVMLTGAPLDLVTLTSELRARGTLDDAGGPAYIASLVDGVPWSGNVDGYGAIIVEKAERRRLMRLGRALEANAVDGDLADVTASARAVLESTTQWLGHVDENRVVEELARERARREARRRLAIEDAGPIAVPALEPLSTVLSRPDVGLEFRIAGWQPLDSRVMLVAPAKSGKSTLVGNLIRSLADGAPFLGVASVRQLDGRIALFDLEMGAQKVAAWLRAQRIRNVDAVVVATFRGKARALDVIDPLVRRGLAMELRALRVAYLVLDPLRPVLDALGLDEHREAGRFLTAIDALLDEAGIPEACLVHHTGHGGERARGDSRLIDWPDATWSLLSQPGDRARYIKALGRDVEVEETQLEYDQGTRRLTITGGGSRRDGRLDVALEGVLEALQASHGPLSVRGIQNALAGSPVGRDDVRAAINRGVASGAIVAAPGGPRGAILHYLSQRAGVCGQRAAHGSGECAAASIEAARSHTADRGLDEQRSPHARNGGTAYVRV